MGHVSHLSETIIRHAGDGRTPINVEQLVVWTYQRQRADVVIGHGAGLHQVEALMDEVEWHNSSACGCAAVERIQRLGVRVDGGGMGSGALHEDAEAVHEAVRALPWGAGALLIHYGRIGERPSWKPTLTWRSNAILNVRGKPSVRYGAWDRHRHYGWCPVTLAGNVARIEAARERYRLWRDALWCLYGELRQRDCLVWHRPQAPEVPEAPWGISGVDIAQSG